MLGRIYRFIAVFLLVGLALYLVLLNRESITLRLSSGWQLSGNAGVIFISIFGMGVVCAALVALFFGIKSYFRERSYRSLERQRRDFYEGLTKARACLAACEWRRAEELWRQLVRKDPTNIIARIELSRSLEGAGETSEALKVLESARAAEPENAEVLFRIAEVHIRQGNKTAAIDNLALILYSHPNRRAAAMARDLSRELGRFSDALEYQGKYESLGSEESSREIRADLEFELLLADSSSGEEEIKNFLRRYPGFAPALERLADIETGRGNI